MAMRSVGGVEWVHVGPTASYLKLRLGDFLEIQDTTDRVVHTGRQFAEFISFMQVVTRLPVGIGRRPWTGSSYLFEPLDDTFANSSMNLGIELGPPNKCRKHADDVGRRKDSFMGFCHFNGPGSFCSRTSEMMIVRLLHERSPAPLPLALAWPKMSGGVRHARDRRRDPDVVVVFGASRI